MCCVLKGDLIWVTYLDHGRLLQEMHRSLKLRPFINHGLLVVIVFVVTTTSKLLCSYPTVAFW